jgi:hypothetical protein
MKKIFLLFGILLFVTSCEETNIPNPNSPTAAAVLGAPTDYQTIIDGAYYSWWNALHKDEPLETLGVAADFSTSSWGNFGMRDVGTVSAPYGLGDHSAINNSTTYGSRAFMTIPYYGLSEAIVGVNTIFNEININGVKVIESDQTDNTNHVLATGYFVRGISYGYLSLLFDKSFVFIEGGEPANLTADVLKPYTEVYAQAISDLEEAITLGNALSSMEVKGFNGLTLNKIEFLQLANSYIAKFTAQLARTGSENTSSDWAKVLSSANAGIDYDLAPIGDGGTLWWHGNYRLNNPGWNRLDQKIVNMADPTQAYPFPANGSYTIPTTMPDARFGEGKDFEPQTSIPFREDRGTYFYSYYAIRKHKSYLDDLTLPMVTFPEVENDLLKAEALIRTNGDKEMAATLINKTRVTRGGLAPASATDADLLDKLFYERYLNAYDGPGSPFFDRRRTDDLGSKQFKDLPIPALELQTIGAEVYTTGGI